MSLKNSYFIIGTDTDIGKTYISSLLYKGLKQFGCSYFKSVQSGGLSGAAPDVDFLCSFNNLPYNSEMEGYVFKEPLSPHLAAEREEIEISSFSLKEKIERNSRKYKYNLIEGAGGIFVPLLRRKINLFNLIEELAVEVILVTSTRVGTINHTMLTLEFLKQRGIPVKGIIFNGYENNFYEDDNIILIKEMSGIKNTLTVPKGAVEISESALFNFMND